MDEGPDKAPRRKRVSRACDRCRAKKVFVTALAGFQDKCDGLRPSCSACLASGQTCLYDPHAKKRGLPEGYVRGLEKLWALAICNIDGFEDIMLSLLGTTTDSVGRRDRLKSLWTDENASETLHESWKTCRLYNSLEKMLSSSSDPSSPHGVGKRLREEHGPVSIDAASEWGFRIDRSSTPLSQDAPRIVEPSASPTAKRIRLSIPADSRLSSVTNGMRSLQLPPHTSQLLDMYFAVTHSWFPIVAKHNILRASYLYANAPSISVARLSPGSGDHAALWAVLSYGSTPENGVLGALSKTKEYYAVARSLIPFETERYELGHVQALLLLTLVNIGLEDWTAAWMLSGQAVRMVISMNIAAFTDTRRSEGLRQGKAVFLGCFVIDSLLSFRLSRRPSMHSRDLVAIGLLEEDGLEEWNSWADVLPPTGGSQGKSPPRRGPLHSLSCFNRLVELASVLNKIARDSITGSNAHISAQQLVSELKQWDDRLPLGCRLIGPESIYPERHSALLPHQTYLGLTYVATLLSLYLRIAPHEMGMHRSQRPAIEGAKKLLYRALPMISQHLDNFAVCSLPPIFELSLHTIAEQAFVLRNKIESDLFPFGRWAEALLQRTSELGAAWPVYRTLTTRIEQWYRSRTMASSPSQPFSNDTGNNPAGGINRPSNYSPYQNLLSIPPPENRGLNRNAQLPPLARRNTNDVVEPDYSSSIMGITIPVDGQYMTPKDTAIETTDPPYQTHYQPHPRSYNGRVPSSAMDISDPANELDAMLHGSSHPHPPTPDSSVSNPTISRPSGAATATSTSGHSIPSADKNNTTSSSDNQEPNDVSAASLDAIFKDLAYLDTTEWATSREAGLKDFGFMDDTTFQEFCHDPQRIAGSQPLVHPPSIADIWPPPGYFPETFGDSAEGAMDN
ncbi:putative C6 transcription factor [Aspergillus mulundensis]|uniref:Putative Zn(II)2Cys6 transcription factor n=1 Tax=Aspergillus mulundensis TaxID=1810919 RepID=A0A3D8QR72_9EURO|nr:putative Zn(II)2Cys6 transcription factor [Aspergillus mulundensis]RDW64295.1 putative Zn(II)2Cys6 transcription factor [Aspergillus mulundensis]